jgi:uncharacterized membrane protein YgcG
MRPTKSIRRALLAFAASLFLAALPLAGSASARELTIDSFNEQVQVGSNGVIDVTEVIDARFTGQWNGIYRTIPVKYVTPQGFGYTLFLDVTSITDGAGQSLKYEQSTQGNYTKFKIYVPGADDATRTVVIRYRVLNAIRFFDDHDELYWNVTGDEWDAPIQEAAAHIELPVGVTGVRASAYTGAYGSHSQDAQVDITGNDVEIHTKSGLGFHEGLTAVVGVDKGFLHEPSPAEGAWLFLRSNWPLFVPIVAFFVMLYLWWTRGRDPRRNSIAAQYDPPENLTPGECGTLVDNSADMRDVTATLVDLAVRGFLTIEQKQRDGLAGLMHHNDYIFHLKKPPVEWTSLRSHEQQMLAALFDGGANVDVSLSQLQNRFYVSLPGIRSALFGALISDGYYLHSPDSVRQAYIGIGGVLAFLLFAGSHPLATATGTSSLAWVIAGVGCGAIIAGFGWYMPAHTVQGVRTLERVLGFEDFLGRVEGDRIERMEKTPELFEKFLPYAMALRVDKKWVQAFSGIAMQQPSWYQGYYGGGMFQPYLLVNDLNMMSTQAATVMSSSPRSSGSSGFGGGGSSGGGFGGGGGGGF